MKIRASSYGQRGATLVMGIIFLTLIMLSVTVAFRLSQNNLKAVGNMQSQAEAEASAEAAVEKLISTDSIFLAPAATNVPVDAYGVTVAIPAPACIRTVAINANTSGDATPNIYIEGVPIGGSGYLETHWDIAASATGGATGANVETHQGVKVILPSDPNPCP
jgi:Tfp pilus assembly protein PilX